jgi:adenylate kinase
MRIVMLGAPGSGKGTQAALLKDRLQVPHISTGELLRAAVRAGTALGKQAQEVMERGELVSDAIMLGMLEERLGQADVANGFILDGYPRNRAQAEALDQLLARIRQPVDKAVQLDVDESAILRRISLRGAAEGRADDNPESVRTRLQVYRDQTAPVIEHFEGQGKLARVEGEGSIDEIAERLAACLQ